MRTSFSTTAPTVLGAVPQPQWEQFASVRDFAYNHTQPQWTEVPPFEPDDEAKVGEARPPNVQTLLRSSSFASSGTWSPIVMRPLPLEGLRVCSTCLHPKKICTCTVCFVCHARFHANRHHCRCCWHAVCSRCWSHQHYVHMLGRRMTVCDRCSTPWALANLTKRDERGLLWGLYVLRAAGDMPRECVGPTCRILTRQLVCYGCGRPTATTQPHVQRVVRRNGVLLSVMDDVIIQDAVQWSQRAMEVKGMTMRHMESLFRSVFHRYEEILAFRAITTAIMAQRVLLSMVAAAVAYEYHSSPNITLSLSDIPYARLLRILVTTERYTILEAPGRVKFIAFPGTHNWRTGWTDLQFSRSTETVWTALHEGVHLSAHNGSTGSVADDSDDVIEGSRSGVTQHGGMRKTWTYKVHKGFAQAAQEVNLPVDSLFEDVCRGGYSLVFCGHSLGGAIAQYLTLTLLHRNGAVFERREMQEEGVVSRLMCVTFGAPLLGNYELADCVQSCGWGRCFHNFVYRSDAVPRLSCTEELMWDAQLRFTLPVTTLLSSVWSWLKGEGGAHPVATLEAPSPPPTSSPDGADAVASSTPRPSHLATVLGVLRGCRLTGASLTAASDETMTVNTVSGAAAATPMILDDATSNPDSALYNEDDVQCPSSHAADEEKVAAYVDLAIRNGRDALENDEAAEPSREAASKRAAEVEAALSCFSKNSRYDSAASQQPSAAGDEGWDCGADRLTRTRGEADVREPELVASDTAADLVIPTGRRMHRRFTCFGRYHFIQYGSYGYVSTEDSETAFSIIKHGCDAVSLLRDHSIESYNRGMMVHLYRRPD